MKSLAELAKLREEARKTVDVRTGGKRARVVVGMATCGISAGARAVFSALIEEANTRNISDVVITQAGCIGVCRLEPIVEVYRNGEKVTYVNMDAQKAVRVLVEHVINGNVVSELTIGAGGE